MSGKREGDKVDMKWIFVALPTLAVVLGCTLLFWGLFGGGSPQGEAAISTNAEGNISSDGEGQIPEIM